ncbi:hypothetical protein BCR44DRAFT_1425731 [Catenaria anguillulae PL171]|uniref:Peptidase M14 domain-containing protein n=1 Tax=Catenaria anguillulae PL171 TaxID=765915 RepID=A0A1Y2HZ00_9FUNG|nr:hypothetical protein BCR44DRAFT_1425731 [Catenaria anguillulae PL171]
MAARPRTTLLTILLLALLAVSAQSEFIHSLPGDLARRDVDVASYKGNQVIRIVNPSKALLRAVGSNGLDVWGRGKDTIDVRVTGDADVSKIRKLNGGVVNFDVVVPDVQAVIDKDIKSRAAARESLGAQAVPTDISYFKSFHTYPEIVEFLQTKCSQFADICSFGSLGKTVEGRDIAVLKLGTPGRTSPKSTSRHCCMRVSGRAPRRPSSSFSSCSSSTRPTPRSRTCLTRPRFTLYVFFHVAAESYRDSLLPPRSSNSCSRTNQAPLVNVDGYLYTQSGNRLWRKNRRRNSNGSYGIDLNRNFAFHWGNGGSSTNPRDDTYRGPRAASEPETQAVTEYFKTKLPRAAQYKQVTDKMRDLIAGVHGEQFRSIKSVDLYPTSGTANDLFYSLDRVGPAGTTVKPYGVAFELRPSSGFGGSGFVLPPEEIIPAGEEILPAFIHFARNAIENPLRA